MTMTTNKSPIRPKLGIPAGEAVQENIPKKYKAQQDIERMNDNSPEINEKILTGETEYVVDINKSPDKKNKEKP